MELSESPAAPANDTNTRSGGPSVTLIYPPWHSWPRGTPQPGSGSPRPDGASGRCRTGSRHPVPCGPRWRRLSGTPLRTSRCTSRCATTALPRCCRRSALSQWQTWESRLGGGDAQAIVATERRGPSGHTVGTDNGLVLQPH